MYRKSIEGENSPESNISSTAEGQNGEDTKARPASADEGKLCKDFRSESIAALRARAQEFTAKQMVRGEKREGEHRDCKSRSCQDDIDVTDSDNESSCLSEDDTEAVNDNVNEKNINFEQGNNSKEALSMNSSIEEKDYNFNEKNSEKTCVPRKKKIETNCEGGQLYNNCDDSGSISEVVVRDGSPKTTNETHPRSNSKRPKKRKKSNECREHRDQKGESTAQGNYSSPSPPGNQNPVKQLPRSVEHQKHSSLNSHDSELMSSGHLNGSSINKFHLDRFAMKMQQICAMSSGEKPQDASPPKTFMANPFSNNSFMGFHGNDPNPRSFHLLQSGILGPSPFHLLSNKIASLGQADIPYAFNPHQTAQHSADNDITSPSQKASPFPLHFSGPQQWGNPFASWLSGNLSQETIMKSSPFAAAAYGFGFSDGAKVPPGVSGISSVGEGGVFPPRPGSFQPVGRRLSAPGNDVTLADTSSPLSAPNSVVAL